MEKKFSAKEAIQFGWQTMKSNFWFFVGLLPLAGFIYIIPSVVSELIRERNPMFSFVWDIIGIALSIIVTLGLIKISLNFCDNTKSAISDILSQYPLFLKNP